MDITIPRHMDLAINTVYTQDKRGKAAKQCCNIALYFLFQFILMVPSLEILKHRVYLQVYTTFMLQVSVVYV